MVPPAFVYVTSVFKEDLDSFVLGVGSIIVRLWIRPFWQVVVRKEGKRTVSLSWLALLQSLSCQFPVFFGLTLTNLWRWICKRHPDPGSSRRICMHSITSFNSPLSICTGSPFQSPLCLGSPSKVVGQPLDAWQTHTFLTFPSSVWTASLPALSQPCHLTPAVLSCSNKHNGQIHKTSR